LSDGSRKSRLSPSATLANNSETSVSALRPGYIRAMVIKNPMLL
jgi:hypothetical protein